MPTKRPSPVKARMTPRSVAVVPQRTIPHPAATRTKNAARSTPAIPISDPAAKDYFGLPESRAGILVTEHTAMNLAGVFRSLSILAGLMSSTSYKPYQEVDDDAREAKEHPVYRMFTITADGNVPAYNFREAMTATAAMRGRAFAEIVRNDRGQAKELHYLDPRRVRPFMKRNMQWYEVYRPEGGSDILDMSEIFDLRGLSMNGRDGLGIIDVGRESLGVSMSAENFGGSFFQHGRPLGFLTKQERMDKPARDQLREEWSEWHQGPENAWNIGILSGGMDWKGIGLTPKDVEFLGTREFQLEEIGRWVGIPGHFLGVKDLEQPLEDAMIELLTLTLLPWARRWEGESRLKLFTRVEQLSYYCEHLFEAILRPNSETRANVMQTEIRNGLLLVNEGRRKLNRRGHGPDGDKPLILASQLATLEQAASGELLNLRMGSGTNNPNSDGSGGADNDPNPTKTTPKKTTKTRKKSNG